MTFNSKSIEVIQPAKENVPIKFHKYRPKTLMKKSLHSVAVTLTYYDFKINKGHLLVMSNASIVIYKPWLTLLNLLIGQRFYYYLSDLDFKDNADDGHPAIKIAIAISSISGELKWRKESNEAKRGILKIV